MLTKYESLSTKSKKIVDRLGWDYDGGRDLRDRLTANVVMLNQLYQSLITSSVFRLESAMGKLLKEFQRGSRDADSISILTSDHASGAKDGAWALIIQDLEDLGITSDIVIQHRAFVVQWFTQAISEGELAGVLPGADLAGAASTLLSDDKETGKGRGSDILEPEKRQPTNIDENAVASKKRREAIKELASELEFQKARPGPGSPPLVSYLQDLLERLQRGELGWTVCNICESTIIEDYLHCNLCEGGDFDLCESCFTSGIGCYGPHRPLEMREWSHSRPDRHRVLTEQSCIGGGNDGRDWQDGLESGQDRKIVSEASISSPLIALTRFRGHDVHMVIPSNIKIRALIDRINVKLARFTSLAVGSGLLSLRYQVKDTHFTWIDSDKELQAALLDWLETSGWNPGSQKLGEIVFEARPRPFASDYSILNHRLGV